MEKGSSRDHNVILIARGETGKTNTYMSVVLAGKKNYGLLFNEHVVKAYDCLNKVFIQNIYFIQISKHFGEGF